VALGPLIASRTDARCGGSGITPVLYAVTAFGVFAAVPDTEEAAALLGASLPVVLLGWPFGQAHLGRAGAASATAVLVWVSALGGRGRPPSIVGAVACLGLLLALPGGQWVAHWMAARGLLHPSRTFLWPVPVLAAQVTVVWVASRVAGLSSRLSVTVPVAAGAGVAALVASTWLAHRWRPRALHADNEASAPR
jgi:hypothetical protein